MEVKEVQAHGKILLCGLDTLDISNNFQYNKDIRVDGNSHCGVDDRGAKNIFPKDQMDKNFCENRVYDDSCLLFCKLYPGMGNSSSYTGKN